ncbi:MAG: tetratricopeptide repeat protein [Saprospiraceae bacterium]
MNKFFLLLFIITISQNSFGQDLHTPSDIAEMMEKSIIYYSFKENKNIGEGKILDILAADYYINIGEDKKEVVEQYKIKRFPKAYKKFEKAKKLEAAQKYSKARRLYQKLLKADPKNAIYATRIGLTFFYEKNYIEAIKWSNKAIRFNRIHYPAYVLLTKIYLNSNQKTEAIKAVTKAHLLNRNDRSIIQLVKQVYKLNGLIYDDTWAYVTQYSINKISDNEVVIEYNGEPWKAYAACRAIWEYEPYYTEKMKITDDNLIMLREYECLLNMGIAYENWDNLKLKKKFTMGLALQKAKEEKMINQFIQFEIELAENPKMVFLLSDEELKKLSRYILQVKSLEIPKNTKILDGN